MSEHEASNLKLNFELIGTWSRRDRDHPVYRNTGADSAANRDTGTNTTHMVVCRSHIVEIQINVGTDGWSYYQMNIVENTVSRCTKVLGEVSSLNESQLIQAALDCWNSMFSDALVYVPTKPSSAIPEVAEVGMGRCNADVRSTMLLMFVMVVVALLSLVSLYVLF